MFFILFGYTRPFLFCTVNNTEATVLKLISISLHSLVLLIYFTKQLNFIFFWTFSTNYSSTVNISANDVNAYAPKFNQPWTWTTGG